MKELVRTNNLAIIAHIKLLLSNENIQYFEADVHMSILEGSIGILPRRILISERNLIKARKVLSDNEINYQ